jgi:hypothetical protein
VSTDHIVILILGLALAVKFVFFDLTNKYRPGDSAGTHTSKLVSSDVFIYVNRQLSCIE